MATTQASGSKSFSCTHCHREFRRLEHLQRHTRRHTHEKPFICSCGADFSRKDLLKRHERLVHSSSSISSHYRNSPTARGSRSNPGNPSNQGEDASLTGSLKPNEEHPPPSEAHSYRQLRNDGTPLYEDHFTTLERFLQTEGRERPPEGFLRPRSADPMFTVRTTQSINLNISAIPSIAQSRLQANYIDHTGLPTPQLVLGTQILPHFVHPVVTESQRNRLLGCLGTYELSESGLPSKDSLTRFLAGYFSGFYPHVPFTHIPTFDLGKCTPELSLSMLTVGAASRYESHSATKLFYLAKALLSKRQLEREQAAIKKLSMSSLEGDVVKADYVDELRCLVCLITFAIWHKDETIRSESIRLRALLGHSLRLSGLEEEINYSTPNWETWAQRESERRTKLLAFCLLNIQDIAYDFPPLIWSHEIKLQLPCSCPEWTAPDSIAWSFLHQNAQYKQGAFSLILRGFISGRQDGDVNNRTPSPVANYVLLHGLAQNIMWTRVFPASLGIEPSADYQLLFQGALRSWTTGWQLTPESNLEPLDPNGPLPFTSTILLSFAYIRNCLQLSGRLSSGLYSWEPANIAEKLCAAPPVKCEWNELLAAHHATHFMDILVKLGVQYVKHNQATVWSVEAALCGLECATFLDKWLRGLAISIEHEQLAEPETLLVDWIQNILNESSASNYGSNESVSADKLGEIAGHVIEFWSDIMHGNSPWPVINMIGDVLDHYRTLYTANPA